MFNLAEFMSKHVFYKAWDIKERSHRLSEWKQLEAQQWWTREQLENLQNERLKCILTHAYHNSDYYKQLCDDQGVNPAQEFSLDIFSRIPVTTKLDIRNKNTAFISKGADRGQLVTAKTGGSTGVSLELHFDRHCQQKRNAAQLMADRWAGWDLGVKRAAVWGNPVHPVTIKQKIRHHLMDRIIYLDTMNLNDASMGDFVDRWQVEKPGVIFGHAHSIFIFARYLIKEGITNIRPRGVIATSMMLLDHERAIIEQAFGRKVTNRYGCEEVGLIASECNEHNGMHLNLPHVYVEFLDANDQPVQEGEPGKIVVTDLNNYAMPLIRYRVEDVGVYTERACPCGRGFPLLERLEGRLADFLKLPDGGEVAGISLVERTLTNVPGIEQMQLIQESTNLIVVNRVKGRDYTTNTDDCLTESLREVFGDRLRVSINEVEHIPQEKSGKYRFSICKI
ncbi:phenylacetate--CoA ligase family protein [Marinobacter sp. X15-166B]|uniref:phenylacetate--CoA ligase family protein n=1 Tax=Marinobacter sp. X15-166B TaxID=1897620 RepID=UPI00085BEBCD|nr:phenylacetate--CoA ligase family protein [Marinobacter sp. X15-166B]OEY68113.1 hypothetical protein BG841_15830 [Marinobacter sp. X15-166B]